MRNAKYCLVPVADRGRGYYYDIAIYIEGEGTFTNTAPGWFISPDFAVVNTFSVDFGFFKPTPVSNWVNV